MKRNRKKKISALLLAAVMAAAAAPQSGMTVHAAEQPTKDQFATVEELKAFNTDDRTDNGGDGKNPAKVYFGKNEDAAPQQWWIAGSQGESELTLFAESPLEAGLPFESDYSQDKTYSADWKCDYTSTGDTAPIDVYPNHYGASPLRTILQGLETFYFTGEEQNLMNDTTVYTNDTKNSRTYSTTNKLYLAYGDKIDDQYITVGTNEAKNLNGGLRIDKGYWGNADYFWLRTPDWDASRYSALAARPGSYVRPYDVELPCALVPAFELDVSSVIFASAAPAASSDGKLDVKAVDGEGAFTLCYQSQANIGTATISQSKQSAAVTDVTNENTYLVVQNKEGAWAKKYQVMISYLPVT